MTEHKKKLLRPFVKTSIKDLRLRWNHFEMVWLQGTASKCNQSHFVLSDQSNSSIEVHHNRNIATNEGNYYQVLGETTSQGQIVKMVKMVEITSQILMDMWPYELSDIQNA